METAETRESANRIAVAPAQRLGVHSDTRCQSPILRQAKIVAQYTVPVVESSVAPVIAKAVASSSSGEPSRTRPAVISACP